VEKIGKYQILGKLGQGGMGVVYKALDPLLERVVALKTIRAHLDSEPSLRARFFREGRSAAQLSHKNIITVYDLGEDNGIAYMAMEFLEGEDLKKKIASKEIQLLEDKLRVMTEICEGLAHAHSRQIIHRDIKPANIFLTNSGQLKILDFGLARIASSEMTHTGIPLGSPNYMSPEQARGERLDHRTDIFSAGALFYELLTFRKPFDAGSVQGTILKVIQEDPQPMESIDPSIHPALSAIVRKALAKDPNDRHQSVEEFLLGLKDLPPNLYNLPAPGKREAGPRPAPLSPAKGPQQVNMAELTASTVDASGKDQLSPGGTGELRAQPSVSSRSGPRMIPYAAVAAVVLLAAIFLLWRFRWDIFPEGGPAAGPTKVPAGTHVATGTAQVSSDNAAPSATESAREPQGALHHPAESNGASGSPRLGEGAGIVAQENQKTKSPIGEGKLGGTAAQRGEVLRSAPADPEDGQLEARLNSHSGKSAADALEQMTQARRKAEEAGAVQYAAKSFQAAQNLESEARRLYDTQRFGEAATKLIDTSNLYLRASVEAESEKLTQDNRARIVERERQRILQRDQAEVSRKSYERERSNAAKAEAEARAPQKFRDAVQVASEAQAKWDREDYVGSKSDFERAAVMMQLAGAAAADAAPKREASATDISPNPVPGASSPANSAQNTRQAISTVLQRYAACLQARDLRTLKSIWPGLGEPQEKAIREEFMNAREIRVQLADLEIKIAGDTATATARRSYEILTVDGQRLRTDTRMVTYLRDGDGSWLIERIRFEPLP
jgi:serine/threonine-protein kinase